MSPIWTVFILCMQFSKGMRALLNRILSRARGPALRGSLPICRRFAYGVLPGFLTVRQDAGNGDTILYTDISGGGACADFCNVAAFY